MDSRHCKEGIDSGQRSVLPKGRVPENLPSARSTVVFNAKQRSRVKFPSICAHIRVRAGLPATTLASVPEQVAAMGRSYRR